MMKQANAARNEPCEDDLLLCKNKTENINENARGFENIYENAPVLTGNWGKSPGVADAFSSDA
jgi:hypothetical protein